MNSKEKYKTDIRYPIFDGIRQLQLWKKIGTEIETPTVYEFTHEGKQHTLKLKEETPFWLLDGKQLCILHEHQEEDSVLKVVKIFDNMNDWSCWRDHSFRDVGF